MTTFNLLEVRRALQKLLDRYHQNKEEKSFITNEKQACLSLIVPLIKDVLHWDTEDPVVLKTEHSILGKRVDYVIYEQNIPQFIIEAKAPSKDIFGDVEIYNQALGYLRGKGRDFAIITNFRQFVILKDVDIRPVQKAEIARFEIEKASDDELNLLLCFENEYWNTHKEQQNELYNKLVGYKKRIPIDKELLEDMKHWRETILTNIQKRSKDNKFDFDDEQVFALVEEEIQKFIDRLIFICFCEDKELKEAKLKSLANDKKDRFADKPGHLLNKIHELFEDYRNNYDSDLFDKSDCDRLVIDDDKLIDVIMDLREPKGRVPYNFASTEEDILGKAYEQFIGHIQTGKKRFKEKEDIGKRKKEGIYYTPKYIVDYIVNNSVREYIKDKTFEEINTIKILDPACGSGSFLLNAFDVLVEESKKRLKRELTYDEKKNLMLNCIFGVDLDERAVAIAKLNLSLRLAERSKLPMLRENIRVGNSLIDDKTIAKYKAFVWEEEFKDIIQNGGFDVVIGNPPYVRMEKIINEDRTYYKQLYKTIPKRFDLYSLFIEKGLILLKDDGHLGFITPNTLLNNDDFEELRKKILETCHIKKINILGDGVFEGATVSTIIIILHKSTSKRNKVTEIITGKDVYSKKIEIVDQIEFNKREKLRFNFQSVRDSDIVSKCNRNSSTFENETDYISGIQVWQSERDRIKNPNLLSKEKNSEKYKKTILGENITRYALKFGNNYVLYDKNLLERARDESYFTKKEKLLMRYIGTKLICTYDDNQYYAQKSVIIVFPNNKSKISIKYLLSLINSKLFQYLYNKKVGDKPYPRINISYLLKIPIKIISDLQQENIIRMVDKMLSLNKRLNEIGDKQTPDKSKLQEEIRRTDAEIDELVYKIYGMTQEEKKIIEESLK